MRRPFTLLAALLLLIVGLAQATRAYLGLEVIVDGYQVPIMASWIAAGVAGALALLLFRESRG